MKLKEILKIKNLDKYRIKIVRHTTERKYIKDLILQDNFALYQSVQKNDVFSKYDYIITFKAIEGTHSLLHRMYEINGFKKIDSLPENLLSIKEPENWGVGPFYKYDMKRVNKLSDLEERLVIDWGKSALSWHQKKLDKKVVEILPESFVKIFPGYEEVILSFEELSKMINNPVSNRQWKTALSSVYGVYLILNKKNGMQYVGSAYGNEGIWGRWSTYVRNKHGNNKLIKELLNSHPNHYKHFQFSILNIVPNTAMKEEVLQLEAKNKEKLGSRVFGLNDN